MGSRGGAGLGGDAKRGVMGGGRDGGRRALIGHGRVPLGGGRGS